MDLIIGEDRAKLEKDSAEDEYVKRSGTADLPPHGGHVPSWLANRMTELGTAISEQILLEYGASQFTERRADSQIQRVFLSRTAVRTEAHFPFRRRPTTSPWPYCEGRSKLPASVTWKNFAASNSSIA